MNTSNDNQQSQNSRNLHNLLKDSNYNLWILLQQTKDVMENIKDNQLAKYNLSNVEAKVLFIIQLIAETPGKKTTASEISRWIVRKPHSVSTLVARMEKKGLVEKSHDEERKNLVIISLTEKGYSVFNEIRYLNGPEKLIAELPEDERKALVTALIKLRDNALLLVDPELAMDFPSIENVEN